MGQKFLSLLKQLFFEMFVSVDLLGAKYMFLSFGQEFSKHIVDPYKLFPDICYVRYHEKKNRPKIFFTG